MSNFIPIKIPKLSKITKREMDEIKRTDDRTRGSNSTQNETHIVCNERLAREGDKATCCGCLPHSGCLLGIKPFHGEYSTCPIDPDCKIEETMKYVRHKIPHERLPEVSKTKDRALQEDMTKAIKHAGKYMKKEQDKVLKESKEWKQKCSLCHELSDEFIYAVQIGKQIRRLCLVCYRGTFNDPLLDLFNRDRKLKKDGGIHYGLYISFNI